MDATCEKCGYRLTAPEHQLDCRYHEAERLRRANQLLTAERDRLAAENARLADALAAERTRAMREQDAI